MVQISDMDQKISGDQLFFRGSKFSLAARKKKQEKQMEDVCARFGDVVTVVRGRVGRLADIGNDLQGGSTSNPRRTPPLCCK